MGCAAVGSVVITACPYASTATHNELDAHETPVRAFEPSISIGALQVGCSAAGSVVITAFPPPSTATHNDVVGQETPLRWRGLENGGLWSTKTGPAHESRYALAGLAATLSVATAKPAHTRRNAMCAGGHGTSSATPRHELTGTQGSSWDRPTSQNLYQTRHLETSRRTQRTASRS